MCITITGYIHFVNGREYYKYSSSPNANGAYAEGDLETAGRSLAEMVEISILNTMDYLAIPRTEICGQELPPPPPPGTGSNTGLLILAAAAIGALLLFGSKK